MARTDNLTNYLTDIATAIKTKKGDETPIKASDFDIEITNLPSSDEEENNAIVNFSNYDINGYPKKAKINSFSNNIEIPIKLLSPNRSSGYTNFYEKLEEIIMPNNIEKINYSAFENLYNLKNINLPDTIKEIGANAFYANKISITELPSSLEKIGNAAFRECINVKITSIPEKVAELNEYTFGHCGITDLTLHKNIKKIGQYCFWNNKISKLTILYRGGVVEINHSFDSNPIGNETGEIFVAEDLIEKYKVDNNWKQYSNLFKVYQKNLEKIEINTEDKINIYMIHSKKLNILYDGDVIPFISSQKGITWSIESGKATISNDGILTLNDDIQDGENVIVKAVSNYDNNIQSTKKIEIENIERRYNVDLNDGEWEETTETINDNKLYQSKSAYYINNGKSKAKININGYSKFVVYIYSDGESNYDFTSISSFLDTEVTRNQQPTNFNTCGRQQEWLKIEYDNIDGNSHYLEIMYSKDGSGNTGTDTGKFYVAESECE